MACRGRPSRIRERPVPLRTFALRQIDERVARESDSGRAVTLRAEPRVMLARPGVQRREIVLVDQFGQRSAPVVATVGSVGSGPGYELRQVRRQVVTAALAEFVEKVRRPIGLIYLEAVAEDRVR